MTNWSAATEPLNVEELQKQNLRPLWIAAISSVTKETPGEPRRRALPTLWKYEIARKELLRAGRTVSVEDAERRVLGLVNPGHRSPEGISADSAVFLGLQLVLPGETTSRHRHSAGACRFIIEGQHASTLVNGERFRMEPGDLILTPPHHWHEHIHEGTDPVIWLDILDIPISSAVDAIYFEPGQRTPQHQIKEEVRTYSVPGIVPFRSPQSSPSRYPLLHYRWSEIRDALTDAAVRTSAAEPVHVMYTNPENGATALEPYCLSVRMLRPGEEVVPRLTSASTVLHVIEGEGQSVVGQTTMTWERGDVIAAPSQTSLRHRNRSTTKPCFLLQIDNAPLQHKLGWYREL
jgi:gentisate 1,2-dioxygenase